MTLPLMRFFSFRQRMILIVLSLFSFYSLYLMVFTRSSKIVIIEPAPKFSILKPLYHFGIKGNFEMEEEKKQGPGEGGKPYEMSRETSSSPFGYNDEVSKMISLNRTILDTRNKECQFWDYPTDLPTASVVLVFYFESVSVVFRTVNSILQRSPPQFLKEIILVDDGTETGDLTEEMKKKAEEYGSIIKYIKNVQNEGLIAARTIGARAASGDVVIFLDAHCEVNKNWLPPLLSVIKANPRAIAVPIIDGISWNTFEYTSIYGVDSHPVGIFEWGFFYKEMDLPLEQGKRITEPYRSPTHAGGLLAIDRKFFKEIGYYDPGLLIWGGEQYELSFKTWLCHGEVLWVPCSRIGHIYRGPGRITKASRYHSQVPLSDLNHKRVVDAWFDEEHKKYFYRRHPELSGFSVDVENQLMLQKQLKCRSFSWFMSNVGSKLLQNYPYPAENKHWGNIRSVSRNLCLNSGGGDLNSNVVLVSCPRTPRMDMFFRLDTRGHIGVSERGIYYKNDVIMRSEYVYFGEGPWNYDDKTLNLRYKLGNDEKCLTAKDFSASLEECKANGDTSQQWIFDKVTYSDTKIYQN